MQNSCGPLLPDQCCTAARTARASRVWRAKTFSSPSSCSISRSDSCRPKKKLVGTVPRKLFSGRFIMADQLK